jgi:glycosyltransferase 2 family protein
MSSASSSRLRRLYPLIGLVVFVVAAFLVYRALRRYSLEEIQASLAAISLPHLALGALFTAASFLCLSGTETLAVRYTRQSLPYRKIALASSVSLSIGHTLGFAGFSSGAVRYRFYRSWGLSAGDVARIMVFCSLTVLLGLATLGGIACVLGPRLVAPLFGVTSGLVSAVGVLLLALVLLYLALTAVVRLPLRIRHFELPLPPLRLALGQVACGTADFLMVSAVLHQMLAASSEVGYFAIAAGYVVANSVGIASHVPGGLGVFEAVMLALVPGANVVGALVAFRAVYFLIPFALGALAFGVCEYLRRHRSIAAAWRAQ